MKWTNSLTNAAYQNWDKKETGNLSGSIPVKSVEFVIKNHSRKRSVGPDGFTREIYQTVEEEIIAILHKLFWKIAGEGTLPKLFYVTSVTVMPNPDEDIRKRKIETSIPREQRHRNPVQNVGKSNPAIKKKSLGLSQECEVVLTFENQLMQFTIVTE